MCRLTVQHAAITRIQGLFSHLKATSLQTQKAQVPPDCNHEQKIWMLKDKYKQVNSNQETTTI